MNICIVFRAAFFKENLGGAGDFGPQVAWGQGDRETKKLRSAEKTKPAMVLEESKTSNRHGFITEPRESR
jgi:hypothetical protein